MGLLLSILFGFLPMFLFAWFVYWLDRYEKEPRLLLGFVFLWGAVVAAGAAFLVNTFFGMGVYLFTQSDAATELTTGSLIAPIVEESLKGLAVLAVFVVFRREFDSISGRDYLRRNLCSGFCRYRERLLYLSLRLSGKRHVRFVCPGLRAGHPGWMAAPILYCLYRYRYWSGALESIDNI